MWCCNLYLSFGTFLLLKGFGTLKIFNFFPRLTLDFSNFTICVNIDNNFTGVSNNEGFTSMAVSEYKILQSRLFSR